MKRILLLLLLMTSCLLLLYFTEPIIYADMVTGEKVRFTRDLTLKLFFVFLSFLILGMLALLRTRGGERNGVWEVPEEGPEEGQ